MAEIVKASDVWGLQNASLDKKAAFRTLEQNKI
jgi:hypothetical protein